MHNTGIEVNYTESTQDSNAPNEAQKHFIASQHVLFYAVSFEDQTDIHDELVHCKTYLLSPSEKALHLQGNLFVFLDKLTNTGTVFLRQAPHPERQPESEPVQLAIKPIRKGGYELILYGTHYPWVKLDFSNGIQGCTSVLHRYQQTCRPATDIHRDPRFLSNTWGDRNLDGRINHDFIVKEIDAAAELGVEVVQIDDGWQKGRSANSTRSGKDAKVWLGFWESDPSFWEVSPSQFPNGLKPLSDYAHQRGVELGLWYAPDSSNDFRHWKDDANRILELHHLFNIRFFKLDTIDIHTVVGEHNLHRFFERVRELSKGNILFDLDITAQKRSGFWGAISVGPLFLENRYTSWHNYWPHQTLRSLWQLTHWVDPRRLRVELLNNERDLDLYENDPLAPVNYSADALFAMTAFCNPLGWFEVSNLSESYRFQLKKIVSIWKLHRQTIFSGKILPVGECPDGFTWTGFISITDDRMYLLIFRELSPETQYTLHLPCQIHGDSDIVLLAGEGDLRQEESSLIISIPNPLGYGFYVLDKCSSL